MSEIFRCSGCKVTWTATTAAHCSECHNLFSAVSLFDKHRHARGERGGCLDPATVTSREGERLMFYREGMWRGPALTEEQQLRMFGRRAKAKP